MLILWRLVFGHFLADFTLQTDYINHWKRTTIMGMIAHCFIHPLCYVALTWPYLGDLWISNSWASLSGWQCVFVLFVSHFVEDQARVFAIQKYDGLDNTLCFVWDQIVHYAVIFLVIPMGMLNSGETLLIPEKWPVLGSLLVMVTHAGTVAIYFLEKDLFNKPFPGLQERYMGMGERLVMSLFCMIPGIVFLPLAALWFGAMRYARSRRFIDLSPFSLYSGSGIAVVCGLLGRWVLYQA